MIVTIDGPAGAGKSTVARSVATALGMTYLDTGAMYRALTVAALRRGIATDDADGLARMASESVVSLVATEAGTVVTLDGDDVTAAIRTPEVDVAVSPVSAVPGVRDAMVAAQRALGEGKDVVAEGRDMGTVVFPAAEVKVFLTATPEARAHRRAVERGVAGTPEERETLRAILARDAYDSSRDVSPLAAAGDARLVDSSTMTVDEVVATIVAMVKDVESSVANVRAGSVDDGESAERNATAAGDGAMGGVASEGDSAMVGDARDGKAVAAKGDASSRRVKRAAADADNSHMRAFRGNPVDDYYEHDMRAFPLPARAFLCLAINVVWVVSKLVYPWRIEEAERLWEGRAVDGPGRMVVMNHISMVDPVLVVVALYHHGIRTRPISKSEFTKRRFVEWALSRFGCIPVVRGTADVKAVRRAQRALQRGEYVLVFPEGTRIRSDDQPVEIHGGFALMAHMAKAVVQPVAIVGARRNPRQTLPHPHRVFLKVGESLSPGDISATSRKERIAEMERVAVERMYALRDALRREHPGRT